MLERAAGILVAGARREPLALGVDRAHARGEAARLLLLVTQALASAPRGVTLSSATAKKVDFGHGWFIGELYRCSTN